MEYLSSMTDWESFLQRYYNLPYRFVPKDDYAEKSEGNINNIEELVEVIFNWKRSLSNSGFGDSKAILEIDGVDHQIDYDSYSKTFTVD
jgi:hypothetical protein